MKKILGLLLLLLPLGLFIGCTGSGAVTPLTPTKATQPDSTAPADSDVVYWFPFPVTFTMTDPLNGVCLLSKKNGWACGNNGDVLQWDGETWNKVDTGYSKNENLLAMAFADENEGWMVGTHGTILHYLNGAWKQEDAQTEETLYGLAVTPSKNVWVVGSNGTLLNYNGLSWGKIASFTSSTGEATTIVDDLYSISLSGQNNAWAVGNHGLILHYDGQKWTSYGASPSTERLNSVSVLSDVQAWIVGAYGTILRYNGTSWNKMGSAFSGVDLYQVYMKSDDDGWAVGQDGTMIYYDGSRWISHEKPQGKPSLNSLAFYKDMGFMVGQNGTIMRFQPNGEMTKFSFLFKGAISKPPTKDNPYWTLTYTLMNQSPKASPLVTFELPIPKGLEAFTPTPSPTPQPGSTPSAASSTPIATTTPTVGSNPSLAGLKVQAVSSPTPSSGTSVGSAASGEWKMKDNNLEWEVGNISASEVKTVTFLLRSKKGEKKDYPVLLKAVLKSTDKVMQESAPVTLIAAEPKAENHLASTTPTPAAGKPIAVPINTPGPKDNSNNGGSTNASSSPTPGN
jgi:photosystem II stability/assembly factor-like uncharacterized protein